MGFVGFWRIIVNWLLRGSLSRGLSTIGMIAGIGFVIAGLLNQSVRLLPMRVSC
jgi:hypothetical protein